MPPRLAEKVCIITGTGGSVGRAAALVFAREGASVVGCDIDVDAGQATVDLVHGEAGTMSSVQPCDLTSPAECHALVELAIGTFGRLDVVFNNAAMGSFN